MASCTKLLTRKYLVLTVNFLNMFLCAGFPFNMAVLNVEFLRVFGESKALTALVQAVTTGVLDIAAFICGQCVNKYGARRAGMCGGLLAFLGLSSSFFATSIPYLIASIGVVAGFGFSLAYVSCVTSVGEYFDGKSKLVAISIIATGSGFGGMAFPFLMDYLIMMYGLRGCVLIIGGLMGNMACFFAVCKPKSVGIIKHKPKFSGSQVGHRQRTSSIYQVAHNDRITSVPNPSTTDRHQYTCAGKLNAIRKNGIFIIFILGIALTHSSFGASLIYMLEFLQTKGFKEHETILFYFYMNISSTLGRLVPGLCMLLPHMNGLGVSAIFTILSCIASVGLLEATTYYQHLILMCIFGMTYGCASTVISMTTMELVGLDNYAIGIGVILPVVGVSSIVAGAASGWLVDVTRSYRASYYSFAAAQGVSCCLFVLAAILQKFYRSKTYSMDNLD